MADDDIDIEEHNLLDNPIVKNMFPDISVFKMEITESNDEVPVPAVEEFSIKSEQNEHWSTNSYIQHYPINNQFLSRDSVINIKNKNAARVKQYYNVRKLKQNHQIQSINPSALVHYGKICSQPSQLCDKTCPKLLDVEKIELYSVKIEDENLNEASKSIINIKNETNNLFGVVKLETETVIESSVRSCTEETDFLVNKCSDIQDKIIFENSNLKTVNSHNRSQEVIPVEASMPANSSHIDNYSFKKSNQYDNIVDPEDQVSSNTNEQLSYKTTKVILGTKPNTTGNKKHKINDISHNVKVLLENLENFLNKSNRYCKACLRLFPSNKTLTDHVHLIHTQNQNIETESTEIRKPLERKHVKRYRCNLCKTVCSSLSVLWRHKTIMHSKKNVTRIKEIESLSHSDPLKTKGVNTNFKCTHCNDNFTSRKLLIDHMYTVLQSKNKDVTESVRNVKDKGSDSNSKSTKNLDYYRCTFCSSYFTKQDTIARHVEKKHKKIFQNFEKVAFEKRCNKCSRKYSTVNSFNVHVWRYHREKSYFSIKLKNNRKSIVNKKSAAIKRADKTLVKNNNRATKQCINEKREKQRKHGAQSLTINKISSNKNNNFVLKSTLFKCMKCDICFLSGNNAADHVKHMDLLVNWKCLKCLRIFKKEDELLHNQQHIFSDTFEVFEISEANFFYFLYKCPNCVSYFLEKDLFNHYLICEIQTPKSAYCKICDVLIDNNIKELHEGHHNTNGMKLNNILIESELIQCDKESKIKECNENKSKTTMFTLKHLEKDKTNLEVLEEETVLENISKTSCYSLTESKERLTKKMLSFTYCDKCNSFISWMHNLYNHTKDPCSHLVMFVCKYCGLLISNKLINRHRKLHERIPGLTLNEFKFYDLKGKKINLPPIPKYPSCNICLKHFITKTAIISHKCSEDYLTCSICGIKLSSSAFPLHMAFHNYLPKNYNLRKFNDKKSSNFTRNTSLLDLNLPTSSTPPLLDSNSNHENKQLFIFTCKNCKIAIDVYDRVIEHSQEHISNQVTEKLTKACVSCNIVFDVTCYDDHKTLHANNPNKKFTVLSFDVFYATSNNKVWLDHLFGSLPKGEIDKIICKSIYNSERRIKFRIIQDGLPHLTLYKCAKCESYVNPSIIYEHCHSGTLCFKSNSVRCSYCNILLESEKFRIEHEKIHDRQNVTMKSYRIIIFNCEEDKHINHALSLPSHYVLFECKNCCGIVEKTLYHEHMCNSDDLSKCSHCGLLLYNIDYMPHVLKHKEFCSYTEKNMKVILIGYTKADNKAKSRIRSSFRGMKLDYLLYQCAKCQVCVPEIHSDFTHECIGETSITKCLACDLYFEDSQFRKHRILHKSDYYFVKENITVVTFGCINSNPSVADVIVIEDEDDRENAAKNDEIFNKVYSTIDCPKENLYDKAVVEKDEDIFKCKCGLHFLTEFSALSHFKKCNNSRSATQNCSKCGLYFKTSVLYDHLLAHHGSKNIVFKFNIINISTHFPDSLHQVL